MLAFYVPRKQLTLGNDASKYGLGAALYQDDKPIAFASRTMSSAETTIIIAFTHSGFSVRSKNNLVGHDCIVSMTNRVLRLLGDSSNTVLRTDDYCALQQLLLL